MAALATAVMTKATAAVAGVVVGGGGECGGGERSVGECAQGVSKLPSPIQAERPPLPLLMMPLLLTPLLMPLPLPLWLRLLQMISGQANKARGCQTNVNGPPNPPTKAPADRREVWKGATHAGGGPAG